MLTGYLQIDTAILHQLGTDNVRGHILREGGAGLNHGSAANTRLRILDDAGREDDTILDGAVAGNLRTVSKHAAVANLRVVRDVSTFHEHVVVAQHGLAATMGGTVNDYVLADDVVVADDTFRLLATELKVLGQCTDDAALMYLVLAAHTGTAHDADKWEDDTPVTNLYVVFDVDKRKYLTVIADFCLGADFGFGTNVAHILDFYL